MIEPNPVLSTYEKICREKCEWCAKGIPIDIHRARNVKDGMAPDKHDIWRYRQSKESPYHEPPMHISGYTDYSTFNVPNKWIACTAPTKDEAIESLRSALAVARKAVEDASHTASCEAQKNVGYKRLNEVWTDNKIPLAACDCWKSRALAAIDAAMEGTE